jgi:type I restriction enzyme S subunit
MKQVRNLGVGKGFKKTEIGEIPADWEVTRLGDICEVVGGGTPSTKIREYWNGEIPWATPTDITALKTNTIENTEKAITREGLSNSSAKLLPVGSILLTSRATIGECAINSVTMATNQGFTNLVCKKVFSGYVFQYLRFIKQTLVRLASGSTFKEISKKTIRSLAIPFPPLDEQKRIGEVISVVDDAFQKLSEVIEKTKQLKKAMMRRLLTQGIGHTKFKKTEIGKIPAEWKFQKLKENVILQNGYAFPSSTYSEHGIPLIRISNIKITGVDLEECAFLPDRYAIEYKDLLLESGDILVAMSGATTGKTGIVPKDIIPAIFNQRVGRMKVFNRNTLDTNFLSQIVSSEDFTETILRDAAGGAQPNISGKNVLRLQIPIPPLSEQKQISSILSSIDEQLDQDLKCRTKLGELRKALMRVLLTGKVRVKV